MMHPKQLLVVEDNECNRSMLCEILSSEYEVLEAEDGQRALDILKQNKDSIALILLDVMMPVMDGYTFLDRIKSERELSLIPVIVMTQSGSEEDEVAALTHGATDFVSKPYRQQVILHRIASIIKLRETAAMVNQFQYDQLTGLYSREFFCQKVQERLKQNPEREYSLLCANVENFKLYNDAFGTAAGDRLLKQIAEAFRALMGKTGICGRYRADRFFCLQERTPEYQNRIALGADGRNSSIVPVKNAVMKWGIYEITDRTVPVERMCDRALLALESIKGQYKKYYAVYDARLREKLLREQAITDAMESALAQEQFVVYLQPKYSLTGNCIAGAEALVRWNHPQLGFISPGVFIPLFEKNGFISRMDRYVWERVCATLRDWQDKGLTPVPVSVNVSRGDVYQADLADTLLELTQQYGVDPAYLHLEITESAYAENLNQIIAAVDQLRDRGFVIEMDDFGSGYSSLNMLGQMKLDVLKLDTKLIQNETVKPADRSILNDIITMAHRLWLSVVAEGVETREQLERLRKINCDCVQGNFFAKPIPVPEFEELLKAQAPRRQACCQLHQKEARGPCLLVADESAEYRQGICQVFADVYPVAAVSDAPGVLAYLEEHGADAVCAMLLSMTLPRDGAAVVLKALRQKSEFWQIPVLSTIPCGEMLEQLPLARETEDFICKCHPQQDLRRRVARLVDMAAFRKRESSLREEANQDYLTGLLNRRGLQAAMDSLRKENLPMAVCLFDLDEMKTVNDTLGHTAGDRMLRSFAALLRRQTRSGDILCRYGGDEFLMILKGMNGEEAAGKRGEQICRLFREQFQGACSCGIAMCTADEEPLPKLIERADQALYRAKRENKGGCCLWTP